MLYPSNQSKSLQLTDQTSAAGLHALSTANPRHPLPSKITNTTGKLRQSCKPATVKAVELAYRSFRGNSGSSEAEVGERLDRWLGSRPRRASAPLQSHLDSCYFRHVDHSVQVSPPCNCLLQRSTGAPRIHPHVSRIIFSWPETLVRGPFVSLVLPMSPRCVRSLRHRA